MTSAAPRDVVPRGEVLERIVARLAPMNPDGIDPPRGEDTVQLRIGTLVAETSWPELSELTGVPNARGDTAAVVVAFPAIERAARQRHGLTRRLMIRVWEEPDFGDRLMERLRPGAGRRARSEWLVWGDRGGRWSEEP